MRVRGGCGGCGGYLVNAAAVAEEGGELVAEAKRDEWQRVFVPAHICIWCCLGVLIWLHLLHAQTSSLGSYLCHVLDLLGAHLAVVARVAPGDDEVLFREAANPPRVVVFTEAVRSDPPAVALWARR